MKHQKKERVSKLDMAVVPSTEKDDDHQRSERVQTIANWLLAEWAREQRGEAA